MEIKVPDPERLPFTADHYNFRGKPAALLPGRCGVVYEPAPRIMPWTELMAKGKPISADTFRELLYSLD
jgi:hypothetical protein